MGKRVLSGNADIFSNCSCFSSSCTGNDEHTCVKVLCREVRSKLHAVTGGVLLIIRLIELFQLVAQPFYLFL
jgi:hypothetical protein